MPLMRDDWAGDVVELASPPLPRQRENDMNMVVIGGGQAALVMMEYFLQDEEVKIVGVVDVNAHAPGVVRARELGIPTGSDLKSFVTLPNVGAVLEITGNAKVRRAIIDLMRPDQDLMTAGSARLMSEVLTRVTAKRDVQISDNLHELKNRMSTTIEAVDRAAVEIGKVLRAISVLALNGNVEAARAGAAGAAFGVVVEHMHDLVEQVQNAVGNITSSSQEGHAVLQHLSETENQLRAQAREDGAQLEHAGTPHRIS